MAIINGIEEEVLIDRMLEGDQTAFELLFRFYYPGLVIFAKQIIIDVDEAEEIVQDFFDLIVLPLLSFKTKIFSFAGRTICRTIS